MAWDYEQKFNDLNDGDLNGQDSWSGSTDYDVQTSVKYEGAKAVSVSSASTREISRTITGVSVGSVYWAGRRTTNSNVYTKMELWDGDALPTMVLFHSTGYITIYDGDTSTHQNIAPYVANQWYVVNVEFNCTTNQARARVHDGDSWSAFTDWYDFYQAGDEIDKIVLVSVGASGVTNYWDTITPTDPTVTAEPVKIEKSSKYCVATTPSAETKSLKYTVVKEITAITKSLKYCVLTIPTEITKSLKYCVIETPSAKTKSLKYTVVKEHAAIEKSLDYEIGTKRINIFDSYSEANYDSALYVYSGHRIARGQSFTAKNGKLDSVKFYLQKVGSPTGNCYAKLYAHTGTYGTDSKPTGSALATSDAFNVADIGSGSLNLVTFNFTGDDRYALEDGVYYVVQFYFDGGDVDNRVNIARDISSPTHSGNSSASTDGIDWVSLADDIIFYVYGETTVVVTKIEKSLAYEVLSETAIQKSLKYTVATTPSAKTKSLKYSIFLGETKIEKGLIYEVIPSIKVEKTLKYCVEQTPTAETKSLKYTVTITPTKTEKGLEYYVLTTPSAKTKGLIYKAKPSVKIQKGLIYKALPAIAINKSLKYTVGTTPSAKTKSLGYNVFLGSTKVEKGLEYAVIKEIKTEKGLIYKVKAEIKVEKSLKYTTITTPAKLEKSLAYYVLTVPTATQKSLKYCVLTDTKIEKSLKYSALPAIAIQKALKYTTITTPTEKTKELKYNVFLGATKIEKGLVYKVAPSIKIQKDLKYTVRATPSAETKSLKYTVIATPAKTEKDLKYCVVITPSAETKGLIYRVSPSIKIEKSLTYKALPAIAVQKTLKYTVRTTPSALTKPLKYVVNPPPPQEIPSGKVVVVSDPTTATTPEDIDGLSLNITLKNEGYIMAFMTLTSDTGLSDHKKGYFLIDINGVASPVIARHHYANKDGNIEVVFRSGLLQAGQYTVKGRHYTEAGVTLTSKNITLIAFPMEDEGGNRIKSVYDTVASDAVTGSTPEDIDGLTQNLTTEVLSFIFGMIVGSVSTSIADKLYRLILSINGKVRGVERTLDEAEDIGSVGVSCRSETPETAGAITIKGMHASEAGVTGTIAPAIMVAFALSTKSGGTGYVIPSGHFCIMGAELSTISTDLEDMPTVVTEVTLTQEAHIFAVLTLQSESEKDNRDNAFAISINGVDYEECGRTSNGKLDEATVTVIARTTSKLAAGTYVIKGRWKTSGGNTLRAINDLALTAIGLETTTQDLPTHLLRGLEYKVVSPYSITKDLKYTVLTTPTEKTKGLIYKVAKAIPITKGLIYKVLPAISINKPLKYCVPTTPAAKTKELKYNIFLGSTKTEKALTYNVVKSHPITKGLEYVVQASPKITRTLKYTVETTPSATQKQLKYNVFLGSTKVEKALAYKVLTSTKIEKGLIYKALPSITINKDLKYAVPSTPSAKTKELKYSIFLGSTKIEKGLIYDVLTDTKIEKSLQYKAVPSVVIQKSLKYTTTSSTKIEKSLTYKVAVVSTKIEKSLTYSIFLGETAIQKGLVYKVAVEYYIPLSLKYTVRSPVKVEKDIKYVVEITPSAITKALGYNIYLGATQIQKSLQYAVKRAIKATKGLIYKVLPSTAINKSLKYCVPGTPTAKQKDLKYVVLTTPTALTKGLEYSVLTIPSAITKSLAYGVLTQTKIEKDLGYEIISEQAVTKSLKYVVLTVPSAITKGLEYRTLTETKIEKGLHYEVLAEKAITKGLKYTVIPAPTAIQKALEYRVSITPTAITKGLHYEVLAEVAITKSLKYCVINQPSAIMTKGLVYHIGGMYPYSPAVSPYEKQDSPYDPASSPYEPFPT